MAPVRGCSPAGPAVTGPCCAPSAASSPLGRKRHHPSAAQQQIAAKFGGVFPPLQGFVPLRTLHMRRAGGALLLSCLLRCAAVRRLFVWPGWRYPTCETLAMGREGPCHGLTDHGRETLPAGLAFFFLFNFSLGLQIPLVRFLICLIRSKTG